MSQEVEEIQKQITALDDKFNLLVNDVETVFYQLLASKASKKSIEEIVEHAVIQQFNISKKEFYGSFFKKEGKPNAKQEEARPEVIEARKWFLSIMRNILYRSPYFLKNTYPFYHHMIEIRHRPVYGGAIIPKTEEDRKNNKLLRELNSLIKAACLQEGVLDEMKEYDFL